MEGQKRYQINNKRFDDEFIKQYSDQITRLCLNKCVNDYDEPSLSESQKICLSRCVFKFRDTIDFGNRITAFLEYQVNKEVSRLEEYAKSEEGT